MIWEELKAFYPDPAIFIPNTSGVVVAWCDALAAWLDSEENEGVVEKLLDSLSRETRLKLFLEVNTSPTLHFARADGTPGFADLACKNSVGFKALRFRD